MMPRTRRLLAGGLVVALLLLWGGYRLRMDRWMRETPLLVVEVRGDMDGLDVEAYEQAFRDAGVQRIVFVQGSPLLMPSPAPAWGGADAPAPARAHIVLEGRRGPNPRVPAASRKANMQGPGYTEGSTAIVYVDDLRAYQKKHRAAWTGAPGASPSIAAVPDEASVWRHLVTNTAVHESWHAITHSHSHNPVDVDSVMYANAADNVGQLGTRYLPFTRGHRGRLQEMFARGREAER